MKKFFVAALAAALVLTGCSSSSSDSGETQGTLTVGMEAGYAPYNWQTSESSDYTVELDGGAGYADGYDVVMAQKIADKMNYKLVIKKISWDGLQPAVESGEIDAIIAGMTANEEREEGLDFTTPYYNGQMCMIVRKDSEMAKFTSIQDFAGYKVMGQKNTNYDTVIDQIKNVKHETPKATYPELVVALQQGDTDGIPAETPVAIGITQQNSDLTYITFDEGKGFDVDATVSIGMKNDSKDSDLFKSVQEALDSISEEERQTIMEEAVKRAPTDE